MAQVMPLPLTVSFFSKIQIGFTFLEPSHPGNPGVCVCVCETRLTVTKLNQNDALIQSQMRLEQQYCNLLLLDIKKL